MKKHIHPNAQRLSVIGCALVALALGLNVFKTVASLFGDVADPDRPGHLKGESVSQSALLIKALVVFAFLAAAAWLQWRAKKSNA